MARFILRPEYNELKGRIGDLVHYKWKGLDCARIYIIPPNPRTKAQQANRQVFANASKSWGALPRQTKDLYNLKAASLKVRHVSGFNLYIADFINGRTKSGYNETAESNRGPDNDKGLSSLYNEHPLHIYTAQGFYMVNKGPKRGITGKTVFEKHARAS